MKNNEEDINEISRKITSTGPSALTKKNIIGRSSRRRIDSRGNNVAE
jgi:hypothetical protein